MKKSLQLLGLAVLLILAVLVQRGFVYARISGTQPTTADAFCVGGPALEVCVDGGANLVPTTTGVGALGSSSLKWASVNTSGAVNALSVVPTDTSTSRLHAVQVTTTVIAGMTPGVGDLFVTKINATVWTICFATASAINSVVLSSATSVRCSDAASQSPAL